MAARSIASETISFGLVSIPVRLYVATQSQQASFNLLHEMYYGDEVRSFAEIPTDGAVKLRDSETELARRLVEQLSAAEFRPDQYRDEYRDRLMEAVQKKVDGEEVTVAAPTAKRAEVIDLMEALKKSLAGRKAGGEEPAAGPARAAKRRPAAATRRREAPALGQRAHKTSVSAR